MEKGENRVIKRVCREDLPECLEVIHKSYETEASMFGVTKMNCPNHTSFLPIEKLESFYSWGFEMYAVTDESNTIVGFFSLSIKEKDVFEVKCFSVLPHHRRKGYGTQMVEHAKSRVKELGGKKLIASVADGGQIEKKWYGKNGFSYAGASIHPHLPFAIGFMEWINE